MIDSHLHITDYEAGVDIDAVIREAAEAGISVLVCNGTSEEDWPRVRELAESNPSVLPCFGVHPWWAEKCTDRWLSTLEEYLRGTRSAVGEIGMDRLREDVDIDRQEEVFRAQLDIARRLNRPATIHCVRVWGRMVDVLRSEPALPCGMLFHSYGGSADLVGPLAKMGAYFSFSGKVLYSNYERARRAIKAVPPDRLLMETDAPCMLPPEEFRVRTSAFPDGAEHSHPANLPLILRGMAELLGQNPERLGEIIEENTRRFFAPVLGA